MGLCVKSASLQDGFFACGLSQGLHNLPNLDFVSLRAKPNCSAVEHGAGLVEALDTPIATSIPT